MFLNVILGAIDGTRVLIKTPSGYDGCQYINRKGRASINVSVSIWLFKIICASWKVNSVFSKAEFTVIKPSHR